MITYVVTENAYGELVAAYSYSSEDLALKCVKGILKKYTIGHLEPAHYIKTAVIEINVAPTLLDAH